MINKRKKMEANLNNRNTKVSLLVACLCLLTFSSAFADRMSFRMPSLEEDFTDRANIVLLGTVKSVVGEQKEGPATARVEVIEILKGKDVGRQIEIGFIKSEGKEEDPPVQLLVNEQYVLFLTGSDKGYALLDRWDGAERLTPEAENKARELVKQDGKYDELFKHIKVSLKVENPDLIQGEEPILVFSVTNEGKDEVAVKGEVVSEEDGIACMRGWMRLILEELKNGKVHKLGGAPARKNIIIPAGASLKWVAKFDWPDFGDAPGTYRLKWKLGKVVSEPVDYKVVKAPIKWGEPYHGIQNRVEVDSSCYEAAQPIFVSVYIRNATDKPKKLANFHPLRSDIRLPEFLITEIGTKRSLSIPPGLFTDSGGDSSWQHWYQIKQNIPIEGFGSFTLQPGEEVLVLKGDLRDMLEQAYSHCSNAFRFGYVKENSTKRLYADIVEFCGRFMKGGKYELRVIMYGSSPPVSFEAEKADLSSTER